MQQKGSSWVTLGLLFTDVVGCQGKALLPTVWRCIAICWSLEMLFTQKWRQKIHGVFSLSNLLRCTAWVKVKVELVEQNGRVSSLSRSQIIRASRSRLHLITGPNMGGKSTYIRQLGSCADHVEERAEEMGIAWICLAMRNSRSIALIALLNQMGSFVPCRAA